MKSKHNRLRLLLFPILIPIFIIGWCMSFFGDNWRAKQKKHNTKNKADFSFMPAIFEKEKEITQ